MTTANHHYIRRLEQSNHTLRTRNGELYEALKHADPTAATNLTPIDSWPSHYNLLDNLITTAATTATTHREGKPVSKLLDELTTAVEANANYWNDVTNEISRRQATTIRARIAREAKKAA